MPFIKGEHHTKETKTKISESLNGRVPWNKDKQGCFSEESRTMMSEVHLGEKNHFYGKHLTEEHKQKIRLARKGQRIGEENSFYGKRHTEKTKGKISKANKGKVRTEEEREKISLGHIDWDFYNEHGCTRSQYPYGLDWTPKLKKQIAERDGYICQLCTELLPDKWGTHHIDYNKDNNEPSNLIFLCNYCHGKTNNNRAFWELYFKQLQNARGFGVGQDNISQTIIDNWT